ncbi:major facilitator superfamily domain-containing protein 12-like [Anoplophora glabripennis]|uniref:major facilitator superfamily domain-containing protein 12-like n=1 Tax=Anoplophora glabripennis TaxID=217634 RepID=UPI000874DFB0|nr:major facilitator superfamily domain-containing protein 12-like [Anoplophora glabripennis]
MEPEVATRTSCLLVEKVSFGLGHIFNDLCAAMWFSYTLFYLQVVLTMESSTAGILLMIGQVVDSLATPVVGWAIDYTGHRRLWHLGGTIAVSVGFPLIFSLKPSTITTEVIVYYVVTITLFQTGWAIVQISHLSLIPEISRNHNHSSELTAIRYTASVCCNISVYFITLIMLKTGGDDAEESEGIGPSDFYKFKGVALIITFTGLLASMFFYCGLLGTQENEYEVIREADINDVNNLNTHDRQKHFLKSLLIYGVSLMYMASRLFTILNLIYIPLYIDERGSLVEDKARMRQTIASIPLTCYIASFLTSIVLKFRNEVCNDKITYLCGSLFGLSASIWIGVGVSTASDTELYVIAVLLGICGSSTMVASLCLTANFVKTNGYGGGRVYSMVTFTDKLISGGVVLLVQNLQCTPKTACPNFYENVLSYICGLVSVVGLASLALLEIQIRKIMRRS